MKFLVTPRNRKYKGVFVPLTAISQNGNRGPPGIDLFLLTILDNLC